MGCVCAMAWAIGSTTMVSGVEGRSALESLISQPENIIVVAEIVIVDVVVGASTTPCWSRTWDVGGWREACSGGCGGHSGSYRPLVYSLPVLRAGRRARGGAGTGGYGAAARCVARGRRRPSARALLGSRWGVGPRLRAGTRIRSRHGCVQVGVCRGRRVRGRMVRCDVVATGGVGVRTAAVDRAGCSSLRSRGCSRGPGRRCGASVAALGGGRCVRPGSVAARFKARFGGAVLRVRGLRSGGIPFTACGTPGSGEARECGRVDRAAVAGPAGRRRGGVAARPETISAAPITLGRLGAAVAVTPTATEGGGEGTEHGGGGHWRWHTAC